MRIRMTHDVTGMRNGEPWPPRGTVVDLPDAEALDYINADMAVPVTVYRSAETMTADTVDVELRGEDPATVDEPKTSEPVRPSPKDFRGSGRR